MKKKPSNEKLRALPAVQDVLRHPAVARWLDVVPRPMVIAAIQSGIDAARRSLVSGGSGASDAAALLADVATSVGALLSRESSPGPHPVINATGVLVHTNLGRAPLAAEAIEHLVAVARGYSTLEYDLATGERGSRQSHVESLLVEALGTESAIAVNNNAAGVMLVLATLAAGRDVIVSRGELVEIGGSFRVPDILRASGARLVEVGTTNRTHLEDYASAIGQETALVLKVHTSNFRVVGFTAEVSEAALGGLCREKKIPFVADVGSGLLAEMPAPGEPTPKAIAKHADVVTFSGDKLLGGPQAGIVAGKKALLDPIRKHPLARAFRIDKLSLAALAATLRLTLDRDRQTRIPLVRMAREPLASVKARADRLRSAIGAGEVVPHAAAFGGGSVPGQSLPSFAVRIQTKSPDAVAAALRAGSPPVIVRVAEDALWLDARTIGDHEVDAAVEAVRKALS